MEVKSLQYLIHFETLKLDRNHDMFSIKATNAVLSKDNSKDIENVHN